MPSTCLLIDRHLFWHLSFSYSPPVCHMSDTKQVNKANIEQEVQISKVQTKGLHAHHKQFIQKLNHKSFTYVNETFLVNFPAIDQMITYIFYYIQTYVWQTLQRQWHYLWPPIIWTINILQMTAYTWQLWMALIGE